jgi:flagellar hook-length control protein FliK
MPSIQSFSPVMAAASPLLNQDRTAAEPTEFDDLLNSISKPENGSETMNKVLDDKKPTDTQAEETMIHADNLLALLMNGPTAAPTPTPIKPPQSDWQAPQPEVIERTLPPSLELVAHSLDSQMKALVKPMLSSTPQPLVNPGSMAPPPLTLESDMFQVIQSTDQEVSLIEPPNYVLPHGPQAFKELEATSASRETLVQSHVPTPFGHEGWDKAISQRVTWLLQDQLKSATVTVNPRHLGPIQIQIQMDNQQINVQFFAGLPEVRQALQDAIPVLKNMLGESGLQLGQSDVSDHQNHSKDQANEPKARRQTLATEETVNNTQPLTTPYKMGSGLLNTFA